MSHETQILKLRRAWIYFNILQFGTLVLVSFSFVTIGIGKTSLNLNETDAI